MDALKNGWSAGSPSQKPFFRSTLLLQWLVRHSSVSPNQQLRPFAFSSVFFFAVHRYSNDKGFGSKGILFSSGEEWREQRRFALKHLRGGTSDSRHFQLENWNYFEKKIENWIYSILLFDWIALQ